MPFSLVLEKFDPGEINRAENALGRMESAQFFSDRPVKFIEQV
jgi:hypothetical protein